MEALDILCKTKRESNKDLQGEKTNATCFEPGCGDFDRFLWVACTGTEQDATDIACADVVCEEGQTCVDGACQDDSTDPTDTEDTTTTDPATDDESDTSTDSEPEPEPEATGTPCESDADCAEELFCESSQCVAPRDRSVPERFPVPRVSGLRLNGCWRQLPRALVKTPARVGHLSALPGRRRGKLAR